MLQKLISGGQTGVDRAALDFAIAHGIPHGGWCPRGRLAEDGTVPLRYQLRETPNAEYGQRTEWNVRDADATVIFSIAATLGGGSLQTSEFARRHQKPCLHLPRERDGDTAVRKLHDFLLEHEVRILNVAGSRQSEEPEVAGFTREMLEQWAHVGTASPGAPASLPAGSKEPKGAGRDAGTPGNAS
jgi:hypothetical protein